jgi:hypothetical protein
VKAVHRWVARSWSLALALSWMGCSSVDQDHEAPTASVSSADTTGPSGYGDALGPWCVQKSLTMVDCANCCTKACSGAGYEDSDFEVCSSACDSYCDWGDDSPTDVVWCPNVQPVAVAEGVVTAVAVAGVIYVVGQVIQKCPNPALILAGTIIVIGAGLYLSTTSGQAYACDSATCPPPSNPAPPDPLATGSSCVTPCASQLSWGNGCDLVRQYIVQACDNCCNGFPGGAQGADGAPTTTPAGACYQACAAGMWQPVQMSNAGDGSCTASCPCNDDQTACDDGTCTDVLSDPNHCGDCDTSCGTGQQCSGGACQCPGGTTYCGANGCVDTTADPNNCGGCGNVVDTTSDPQNCGACGNACAGGQTCSNGSCTGQPGPTASGCGCQSFDALGRPLDYQFSGCCHGNGGWWYAACCGGMVYGLREQCNPDTDPDPANL